MLNRATAQLYPIRWAGVASASPVLLRLPAVAFLTDEQLHQTPTVPSAVGDRALQVRVNSAGQPVAMPAGLLLGNFRQFQDVAIPYWSDQTQTWEPVLQWSDQHSLALAWIQQVVVALLSTLLKQPTDESGCSAEGLEPEEFQTALSQLAGVGLGCPVGWSDTYRFNLREAVLTAGLVAQPAQIFFVEDAIAALIAELPDSAIRQPAVSLQRSRSTGTASWKGGTLVLSAGATMTELLLLDLPQDFHQLTRSDLALRSIAYGGSAIDQDIICQLFYPSVWGWRNLGEPSLDLPLPGEPDLPIRYRLQQRLQSTSLGRILLAIARQLKVALQNQEVASFSLNDQQWTMTQQALHSRVIVPYLQLLNRELSGLLAQTGIGVQTIQQVVLTGGTASFPEIGLWLQQKFPNAMLIQDQDPSPNSHSKVALGLAKLPFYPQFLEGDRHQYGEYFLLQAILRSFPDHALSLGQILQLLEAQGINAQICQQTILDFLEGQLPEGLVPSQANLILLTPASRQFPEYQMVRLSPVFSCQSNRVYRLDLEQRDRLCHYLATLLKSSRQKLEQPLSLSLTPVTD
ncbi:MAG: hypothetical protein WCA35_27550 [Kovacikia sp.]